MYDGVRMGFTHGHLIPNELNYFYQGRRKFVIHRDFVSIKDIDVDLVKLYLHEAGRVDLSHQDRPIDTSTNLKQGSVKPLF